MLFTKIYAILTGLVLLSVMICGLWMRYSGVIPTAGNISFHTNLGILSVVMSLVLVVIVFVKK